MYFRESLTCSLFAIITLGLVIPQQVFSQTAQTKPAQTQPAQTQQTQTKPAAEQAESTPIEWPKEFQHAKGKVVIYQPQIDEWPDYKVVKARSAVAFLPKGHRQSEAWNH